MKKTLQTILSPMKKTSPAESIDSYLAVLHEEVRNALEKLHKIIKAAAPGTTEVINYRIHRMLGNVDSLHATRKSRRSRRQRQFESKKHKE
jgi:hypothetical protein